MRRVNEVKLFLTDQEMRRIKAKADRELIDPGMWMRRTAVSIADGRACVVATELADHGGTNVGAAEKLFGKSQKG